MENKINIKLIEDFMHENNISKTRFCNMCKISLKLFNKIMANDDGFRIIALFKIARVIKVQVHQMFV